MSLKTINFVILSLNQKETAKQRENKEQQMDEAQAYGSPPKLFAPRLRQAREAQRWLQRQGAGATQAPSGGYRHASSDLKKHMNIYTYTYMYVYINIHIYIHMYTSIYLYIYTYICVRECKYISIMKVKSSEYKVTVNK